MAGLMKNNIFTIESVDYSYPNGQQALHDITFSIAPGERVAILGANASGKSTLLQLMDALIYCKRGRLTAFGQGITERSVEGTEFGRYFRRQVAFLFQNVDAQLFCSTVEDELAFGPRHLGMDEDKIVQRIESFLDIFNLRDILKRSPQTLSGGEKRRVGLAAVLTVSPSVLMLDEPTSGLDPRSRTFLIDTLQELSSTGKTLIIATHDLELAGDVTDRTIVLGEDHRIYTDAPVTSVLRDHDLLSRVNLVHLHPHKHGKVVHVHPHSHVRPHEHSHQPDS